MKEAISQGENASFFDEHFEKSTPKINPDEVIEGIWEDSPNNSKNNVEKSQLESVENIGENGIIEKTRVLTLDDLTKDVLKTKPPYSPRPKRWLKKGGKIEIAADGNWIYTDLDGVTVKYTDGYPDFETAGVVEQKVNIGGFKNRTSDVRKANALVSGGPCKKGYVWHHSQDGQTMMLIKEEIHKKFTHRGGFSLMKMKRRE